MSACGARGCAHPPPPPPPLPPTAQVASLCADNVVNTNVPCCGMAGDRGMRFPELTAASLQVRRLLEQPAQLHALLLPALPACLCNQPSDRRSPACPRPPPHSPPLQHLNVGGCSDGYSTSRTCEMSLSNHSGINFRGLVYLVDEATSPKKTSA